MTSRLLVYLGEFGSRDLQLRKGYSSLFNYLVEGLNYSEAAASRRITGARMLKKMPALFALIEQGDLHLSALQLLAPYIGNEGDAELLNLCRRKSKRAIEELLARRFATPPVKREVVRLFAVPIKQHVVEPVDETPESRQRETGGVFEPQVSGLHYDHLKPFSVGGLSTIENIRLACPNHNGFFAREFFGREKMEYEIARRRGGTPAR